MCTRSAPASNRDGIGSRVTVTLDNGKKLWSVVKTGSSYCSQSELPLTFGLGKSGKVTAIEITWPNGRSESVRDIGASRSVTIEEGKGLSSVATTDTTRRTDDMRVRLAVLRCSRSCARGATLPGCSRSKPLRQAQGARENAYRANNLGVALLEQYLYDEAAKSFRQALELQPDLHIARLNLAIALLYAGQVDDALSAAKAAAERLPAFPHPHYVIGLAARAQGRADDAVAAFRRVLEMDSV